MSKRPNYSWDSTVFIAWLAEEATAPLADIAAVAQEIDDGNANLIVSVTAYAEVLEAKHTDQQMSLFRGFLQRSNVVLMDQTIVIAEKAGQIRSKGLAQGRKIKTPDAVHLATAILAQADVFHTLDDGMLTLSGNAIVDGLIIGKPALLGGQRVMF